MIQRVVTPLVEDEVSMALSVLLDELNVESYEVREDALASMTRAIQKDAKVRNSALLLLQAKSSIVDTMRIRLVRDVMELYKRGY
tara:strand:- start:1977 stop:2231 length:255 start_codon:yes stop_codon:yes gene_type:complete